jgi:8-oxo-dGTP diphosphatase
MIKYVLCVTVDKAHKNVVLIHKLKPSFQKGKLNCPGGKVELSDLADYLECLSYNHLFDNTPMSESIFSAKREFLEETGVSSRPVDWKHIITLHSGDLTRYGDKDNWEMYICFTDALDITQVKTVESEKIEVFPIDKLPDNIMPNLKWIIPLCLDGKFREVIHIKET